MAWPLPLYELALMTAARAYDMNIELQITEEQVAEIREAGVQHLLCQTGFGSMSHDQNLASMRRFGEQVMPAFK